MTTTSGWGPTSLILVGLAMSDIDAMIRAPPIGSPVQKTASPAPEEAGKVPSEPAPSTEKNKTEKQGGGGAEEDEKQDKEEQEPGARGQEQERLPRPMQQERKQDGRPAAPQATPLRRAER